LYQFRRCSKEPKLNLNNGGITVNVLTIVVPAYNEESRIASTLRHLTSNFDGAQVIVVCDGDDKTAEVAKAFNGVEVYHFTQRLGKGGAIMEGIRRAKGDLVAFVDADLPVSVEEMWRIIRMAKDYDLFLTARLLDGMPPLRMLLHRIYIILVKLMFWRMRDFADFQAGFKVMRRERVAQMMEELIINDFVFDVNLIYAFARRGFRIGQTFVRWRHLEEGSKVSRNTLRIALIMFLSLVKLRIYYSRLRPTLSWRVVEALQRFLLRRL